jgi:hypothetical protein
MNFKISRRFFIGVLSIAALFSACKATNEAQPELGYLTAYNFSPSLATYDVYVNTTRKNSAPLPFGGGVVYAQYLVGKQSVSFKEPGTTNLVFKQDNIDIVRYQFNTFFLTGKTGQQQGLVLKDDFLLKAEAGKAYVRFINLSPDAAAVDFALKDSTTTASNKSYQAYSDFMPFDTKSTVFEVKTHNSNTVLARTEETKLKERFYYTVVFGGLVNPGNNERSLSATLITQQ